MVTMVIATMMVTVVMMVIVMVLMAMVMMAIIPAPLCLVIFESLWSPGKISDHLLPFIKSYLISVNASRGHLAFSVCSVAEVPGTAA